METVRDLLVGIGFKGDKSSVKTVEGQISGLKSFALKALGALGVGFSLKAMNGLAEEFNGIEDKLRGATREMGNQAEIQQKVMDAANATRSSYGAMTDTVVDLVQRDQELFGNIDTAVGFAQNFTMAMKGAGKSEAEVASAQAMMNRVFAVGTMDANTFTRTMRTQPAVINSLSEALGKTKDELQAMAQAGQLTSKTIVDAFTGATDVFQEHFDELDLSISDATTYMRNMWGKFCNELWVGSDVTNGVGKLMQRAFKDIMGVLKKLQPFIERVVRAGVKGIEKVISFCEKVGRAIGKVVNFLGGTKNALKLLGMVIAPLIAMKLASKIFGVISAIKALAVALGIGLAPMLLIIGVFVLLGLAIDDFMAFMKGENSLLGEYFKSQGIDAEGMREKFVNAWETIQRVLGTVWEWIQQTASTIFGGIAKFFADHGEEIKGFLVGAWQVISTVLGTIWEGISAVAGVIWEGLSSFFEDKEDGTQSTFMQVWNAISSMLGTIFGTIDSIARTVFGGLKLFWDTWGGQISEIFSTLFGGLISIIQPLWDFLENLIDFIGNVFSGDWGAAWENIKNMFGDAVEFICNLASTLFSVVSQVFSMLLEMVTSIFSNIWSAIVDTVSNIVSSVGEKIVGVKDAIVDGIQGAIDWITELPGKALQWGKDMIQGFIDGIQNMIGAVGDAVKGVGDAIGNFLHFSKPDKGPLANYETWMPDMMQGLAKGIDPNVIMTKMKDMTTKMNEVVNAGVASVNTALDGMVSNYTKAISQVVNIQNTFNGGARMAQTQGAVAMDKSAKSATTYMANALSTGR